MPPKPAPIVPVKYTPNAIVIPDLISYSGFRLHINDHCHIAAAASESWLIQNGRFSGKKQKALVGLKGGLLAAMVYPDADAGRLRVCADYINYLFHLDNISDSMDSEGTDKTGDIVINALRDPKGYKNGSRIAALTKDFWKRLTPTASEGMKERFISTFDLFFEAITKQATHRRRSLVLDVESYIATRRDTSGCKPCFALIEYANDLHLPDDVMAHPLIHDMEEASNDLITWSNDIFSYNIEQAKGDTHNMVVIVMLTQRLPVQDAVDYVARLCEQAIDRYKTALANLPSFDNGGRVDRDVARYAEGLADWMIGSLHWTFETERYFGRTGREIKQSKVIKLTITPLSPSTPTTCNSRKPF